MKAKVKKTIKDTLNISADRVGFKRDGTLVAKRLYFYRQGMTAEKWLKEVLELLKPLDLTIVDSGYSDRFNTWPKDSWFEARVKVSELAD